VTALPRRGFSRQSRGKDGVSAMFDISGDEREDFLESVEQDFESEFRRMNVQWKKEAFHWFP
jgi:hypothetical protein